jgi:hypothetical protein
VACGTACCAGTGCCGGGACQPAHANGLGQSYYDCAALGTWTLASARLAAGAWAPTGGTDSGQFFSGDCLSRATASACATWCYTGTFAGQVKLNPLSVLCLSPDSTSPHWN